MPFTPYRRVLAVPGVTRLTLIGVVARIPHTAMGLVLTVHVTQTMGRGYATAGLLVAALTIGMALGAPWRGRSVDRLGVRRALLPSVLAELVLWTATPWLPLPWLLAAVVVAGAMGLPVFTVVRLALSVMVPDEQRRAAFALDSVAVELSFMVGPALGVLVAVHLGTTVALILIGVCEAFAGLALMAADPPTRSVEPQVPVQDTAGPAPAPTRRVTVPVTAAMVAVLGATAGATIVLSGTDVSILATLREGGHLESTGLVLGVWAFASLLGGLVYGLLPRSVPPLVLLLVLGVLTAPVGFATTPLTLGLAVLAAGFLCAPVVTATAEVVTELVPEAVRGEAMGWHGSALTSGVALGAPVAGAAID
ncbi:MAG: MFS transporter, partial [Actinomycetota bacterium]